ncbi:CGNR zinc finger domain-containing protein [Streptomyces qinzhouensis]|uniref:Zf-CGNR multi-domain protein n=1 Tax=Streptomyces qinzhouensis TaxID=2599401 RepID=A0A5B8IJ24_9ACTN|nr:ABATE domain-containing protein [Streptomyces qinzhouensis]QDY78452.1 zf-CGNR multi-domain protein [Streptomyces qinzhouensis]
MSELARGFVLDPPSGGRPFHFDAGALCLELLLLGGPGELARWDALHEPADLVGWVARSRLPDGLAPVVSREEVAAGRELRDALYRLASARAYGRELPAADLAVVGRAAAHPPPVPRFGPGATREWVPGASGAQVLSAVARDAVELFTGPYARRIRECGTSNCLLLFVDTSRPGRRRWCSMERCGNRSKVRAHRARRTGEERGGANGAAAGEDA